MTREERIAMWTFIAGQRGTYALRTGRGRLGQGALALALPVDEATMSRYLSGRSVGPELTEAQIEALSRVLVLDAEGRTRLRELARRDSGAPEPPPEGDAGAAPQVEPAVLPSSPAVSDGPEPTSHDGAGPPPTRSQRRRVTRRHVATALSMVVAAVSVFRAADWLMNETGTFELPVEGEEARPDRVMDRSNASHKQTALLKDGEALEASFLLDAGGFYSLSVTYSNDNSGQPERLRITVDREREVMTFIANDTQRPGDEPGSGWNNFKTNRSRPVFLSSGDHTVRISVIGGDGRGVEVDKVVVSRDLWFPFL